MTLSQLTQARWFPSVSKPLLSGLVASGVVFGLHALGITSFEPRQVNEVVTPLVGFLVTAIVAKPQSPDPAPAEPDFIHTIVPILVPNAEQLLRDHPDLLQELLDDAIKLGTASAPAPTPAKPPSPLDSGVIR